MRRNYWTNSKLAQLVLGISKPEYGTMEEWDKWEKDAKASRPIRHWITQEGFRHLQDIIMFPVDKLYNLKYYAANRWITKSNALTAHKKNIKPGEYADMDTRMFYALFDELVKFVEIEKAYSNFRWDEEKAKELKWWQGGRWRTRTWENAQAGVEYLEWEASLGENEEGEPFVPTHQSHAASEVLAIYRWYTEVYPNRPDPYDVSGWSKYCDAKRDDGIGILGDSHEDTKPMHDVINAMEIEYDAEDTEMMIRLIKVRKSLWT